MRNKKYEFVGTLGDVSKLVEYIKKKMILIIKIGGIKNVYRIL